MLALGNAHVQLSDFDNAERYYREVVRMSAQDRRVGFLDDAAYSLGMLYLFSGKTEDARNLIERYDASLESYRILILRGYLRASLNDIDGALEAYREVLQRTEARDAVVVRSLMGDAYRKKGLLGEAIIQRKSCRIEGDVEVIQVNPNKLIKKDPIGAQSDFEHISSRALGDLQALSARQLERTKSKPVPFPSDIEMVIRCSENLKMAIRGAISVNRRYII